MDRFLKESQRLVVLISCSTQAAGIVFSISATYLYLAGKWLAVSLVLASTISIPLIMLLYIKTLEEKLKPKDVKKGEVKGHLVEKLIWKRQIAVLIPDLAIFLNSFIYYANSYVLGPRVVSFQNGDLGLVVLLFNISNVVSTVSAIVCTYVVDRFVGTFNLLILSNILYNAGIFVSFASTTSSLNFLEYPYQLILSAILIGVGEIGHCNLTVYSKIVLFKKWNITKADLAEESTARFNLANSIGTALGISFAWAALTRESETAALTIVLLVGFLVTIGMIFCKTVG